MYKLQLISTSKLYFLLKNFTLIYLQIRVTFIDFYSRLTYVVQDIVVTITNRFLRLRKK